MTHASWWLAVILLVSVAVADELRGRVTSRADGSATAGVEVQAEVKGQKRPVVIADADGRFVLSTAVLIGDVNPMAVSAVILTFSKTDFQTINKVLLLESGRLPKEEIEIQLMPSAGSFALSAEQQAELKEYASPGNIPLYLAPYDLPTVTGASDPQKINDSLRRNLERAIITHLQAPEVRYADVNKIKLKLLPPAMGADTDRAEAYGTYLNALAVITGQGNLDTGTGGGRIVNIGSQYVFIPKIPGVGTVGAPIYVDDALPIEHMASPRLYENLSKLWGRSTLLALGLREYKQAKETGDKEALQRIRKYLQAERANAGPGNDTLVSQINDLLQLVDKELVP